MKGENSITKYFDNSGSHTTNSKTKGKIKLSDYLLFSQIMSRHTQIYENFIQSCSEMKLQKGG